ncbi:hypothetical protein CPB86DRAFT_787268 [Serendipita vermifera]|nr:hypothetical protein CPB86DRAFT_787268 [Serendipita vermifera]
MASINSLPLELLIKMITQALLECRDGDDDFGTVGKNAVWKMPKSTGLETLAIQPSRPHTPIGDLLPSPGLDTGLGDGLSGHGTDRETKKASEQSPDFYATATKLRLVNTTFNQIVTPLLYQDINLLVEPRNAAAFGRVVRNVLLPQAQHIRTLYVRGNPADPYGPNGTEEELCIYITELLKACFNLKSLGLYFSNSVGDGEWSGIREIVLDMVEHGALSYLGLYSMSVIEDHYDYASFSAVENMIRHLARSKQASSRLRGLDLAVSNLQSDSYDAIRSGFIGMESLVIRRAFGIRNGRIWDYGQQIKWTPYLSLKSLRFYGCTAAYSAHIPKLVALFPALRELLVSACGDMSDLVFDGHEEGWHLSPNALCNTHAPSDWIHIDHMDDWEIRGMVTIPTKTLIITGVKSYHLLNEMRRDKHIFPGMKTLRVKKPHKGVLWDRPVTDRNAKMKEFETICQARGITVTRDAQSIHNCSCCGSQGI